MPGTIEQVEAYQCSACEAVVAADEVDFDDAIYECGGGCGMFLRSEADGSNRCPQCNKFGSRAEDGPPCPECREGAMEPVGDRFQASLGDEAEVFATNDEAEEWIRMVPKRKTAAEVARNAGEVAKDDYRAKSERRWAERREGYPALLRMLSVAAGGEDGTTAWQAKSVQRGIEFPDQASWVGNTITLDIDDALRLARYVEALEAWAADVDRHLNVLIDNEYSIESEDERADRQAEGDITNGDVAVGLVERWERLAVGQAPKKGVRA